MSVHGVTIAEVSAMVFSQVRVVASITAPEVLHRGLRVEPLWCHDGVMDLTPYVDTLRRELAVAAEAAW